MQKSLYSLILMDDVVREIDRIALQQNTNRSNLINQILADYVSLMTPEKRISNIFKNIEELINKYKELNYKVGLAIKPNTNINELKPYLKYIDLILVMSVEPGFGGQTFINNTYQKINEIKSKKQNILIEVDGGINNTNINTIKNTADIAVVGSYITNKEDYNEAINTLKN